MIRAERHERILAELARLGAVSAQDLSELLGASLATIRRDIAELDSHGALERTHGGAKLPKVRQEPHFDAKITARLAEKRRIGARVGEMIEEGSTIGLGGGTTVFQILPAIRRMTLNVVTTAINVASDLRDSQSITVTLTGGTLRRRTAEMVGHIAERTLRDVNLDVAVIGVDGIDARAGLTTFDASEAYVNRVMLEQARAVWVVADHSKIGQILPALIAPIDRPITLITDADADKNALAALAAAGVSVILT